MALFLASKYEALRVSGLGLDVRGLDLGLDLGLLALALIPLALLTSLVQIPHWKGQFLGTGAPIVKYRDADP